MAREELETYLQSRLKSEHFPSFVFHFTLEIVVVDFPPPPHRLTVCVLQFLLQYTASGGEYLFSRATQKCENIHFHCRNMLYKVLNGVKIYTLFIAMLFSLSLLLGSV